MFLETKHKTNLVHTTADIPKLEKNFSLFIPSPYELNMVSKDKEIWPRRFSSKQPPQISDTPVIYSVYLRSQRAQRGEIDFFRTVAMTANLETWDAFKQVLAFKIEIPVEQLNPEKLLVWVKNEKCSPYGQELAFRLAQWDSTKLRAVSEVFAKCDPQSFHALWFEVLVELEKNQRDKWPALREKVQNRRLLMANDSFEYFVYTQLFESLDVKIAHST